MRGPLPRMDDESPHRTRSRLSENASFCRNSQMLFVKHVQNHWPKMLCLLAKSAQCDIRTVLDNLESRNENPHFNWTFEKTVASSKLGTYVLPRSFDELSLLNCSPPRMPFIARSNENNDVFAKHSTPEERKRTCLPKIERSTKDDKSFTLVQPFQFSIIEKRKEKCDIIHVSMEGNLHRSTCSGLLVVRLYRNITLSDF